MNERIIKLIGKDNYEKIKKSSVLVIGLGGVGGYAVESLIRSGIENIGLVDYDIIDKSNLNRQIIACNDNIGMKKIEETCKRIKKINNLCHIRKFDLKLDEHNILDIPFTDYDYVIDCCDTIKVKEKIIEICSNKNINFISCMGMGNRINASMVSIGNIFDTSNDPVARIIRKYARDNNIKGEIPVIYSKETNNKFVGSVPSMTFVPAVAGILSANYVIEKIISS